MPELEKQVQQGFDAFSKALDPYREGEGFRAVVLDEAQRKAIAAPMSTLADTLARANEALGLE